MRPASAKRATVAYALFFFLLASGSYLVGPVLVLALHHTFKQTDGAAGVILAAEDFFVALHATLLGMVLDSLSLRRVLITCILTNVGISSGLFCVVWFDLTGFVSTMVFFSAILSIKALASTALGLSLSLLTQHLNDATEESNIPVDAFVLNYMMANASEIAAGLFIQGVKFSGQWGDGTSLFLGVGVVVMAGSLLPLLYLFRTIGDSQQQPAPTGEEEHGSCVSMLRDKRFWLLQAVTIAFHAFAAVYIHLDRTMPLFVERKHGTAVSYASIMFVNGAICLIISPLASRLLRRVADPLLLISGTLFASGGLYVGSFDTIPTLLVAFALFSIGEAVAVPRLDRVLLSIPPKESRARYKSFSAWSGTLARMLTTMHSALLLQQYCPEGASNVPSTWCRGDALFATVGLIALITPLAYTVMYFFYCFQTEE